jgi:hypothetical protein
LTTRATQRTRKPKTTTKRITTTKTTKKVTTSTPPTTILKWKSQKSARKNTELIPEAEEAGILFILTKFSFFRVSNG